MKWLRIILPIFFLVGMLLGVSSVAYADDPPDGDPGIEVDITVMGDNPDVNVDVLGEDSEVTVNTTGTEVWINGQNLNDPTAVYNIQGGGSAVDGGWVKKKIGQAVGPLYSWIEESGAKLGLAIDGLAKVILLAQNNESELETQTSLVDTHDNRLTSLESESVNLGEQVDALEAQDAAIRARVNYLTAYYNRILAIIIGAFSLVVIGLGAGLFLTRRRIHS